MKIIDRKIDEFANYLQHRNNLNHIQFLKVRLGMQVVVSNIEKNLVLYIISFACHSFIITLLTHVCYFLVRIFAHGAHARSSLLCHIQNILLFIFVPWIIYNFKFNSIIIFIVALLGLVSVIKYSPAATKKQPIPKRAIKRKKILSIISFTTIGFIAFLVKSNYSQVIVYGIVLESITLLPIFFTKEE